MKGRPPLWWKSGRFLAWMWVLGTLIIAASTIPFLYQQWVEVKDLVSRYRAMSTYVDTHRESLDSDLSDPPTPDALAILADKVPPDRDIPRLLLQLQDTAEEVEVKLNAVHVADSSEELDRLDENQKEKGKKKSGSKKKNPAAGVSPNPPAIPRVEPVWLDVYLTADIPGLKEWFRQIHQLPRIISVQEWEHRLKNRPGYGNARIRILVYAYRDSELKELPAKNPLDISRDPGDPIRVRPKDDRARPKDEKKDGRS